jgi:hypothetical protein
MKRFLALLFALLVVLPASAGVGAVSVYVEDVTVSPAQPAPGERFTVTVTIQNPASSSTSFEVRDVALRSGPERFQEYTRVEDLGTIPPGGSMNVPLTHSFDSTGVRDLRVFVFGREDGSPVELKYPVVIPVRVGGPQVSVSTGDPVVGAPTRVNVTAVNGEETVARNVKLTLSGENVDVENATRVSPSLESGVSRSFEFLVTPRAERASVTATLRYTNAAGNLRTLTDEVQLDAEPLEVDVTIEASVERRGSTPPIEVRLSNFGNAPLERVDVSAAANGSVVGRLPVEAIPADSSRTVLLNVSDVGETTVRLTASYETGDQRGSVETALDYRPSPAQIRLTGVDFEREGDRIRISGSASNVGLTEADSVVVRVVESDGVTPARPYREFFVGTVPASDFASFDLYATVDPGTESIPVEVAYLVDGEQRTVVQQLDASDLPPAPVQRQGGGVSLPLLLGGLLAVVVVVGGVVLVVRRR